MCEFCHKHGEGKKWYLQAKNYSEDLIRSKKAYIDDFLPGFEKRHRHTPRHLKLYSKTPSVVKSIVSPLITKNQKLRHFGQVVPMEDVEQILEIANCIVRVDCVCRRITTGRKNGRYCFGISIDPNGGVITRAVDAISGPDSLGLERLDRDEAVKIIRGFEHEGLMHSVWTFGSPFIGGMCNCDQKGCLAMQTEVEHGIKVMFKAEHIARVDPDRCIGCKSCIRLCQFGAMGYDKADCKAVIDPHKCYGCGVCRVECPTGAIEFSERSSVPSVSGDW